jgi:hypothetical protein
MNYAGKEAMYLLNKWTAKKGAFQLGGGKHDLGFLFLYELLTGKNRVQCSVCMCVCLCVLYAASKCSFVSHTKQLHTHTHRFLEVQYP